MPPTYLLGQRAGDVVTVDLMGMPVSNMTAAVSEGVACGGTSSAVLVAPHSAVILDRFLQQNVVGAEVPFTLEHLWTYRNHLNLDDLEPAEEGLMGTLQRVIGRRGLGVWKIDRTC